MQSVYNPVVIGFPWLTQMGDHGLAGQHKYQLEEAQRAEKRVRFSIETTFPHWTLPPAGLHCV